MKEKEIASRERLLSGCPRDPGCILIGSNCTVWSYLREHNLKISKQRQSLVGRERIWHDVEVACTPHCSVQALARIPPALCKARRLAWFHLSIESSQRIPRISKERLVAFQKSRDSVHASLHENQRIKGISCAHHFAVYECLRCITWFNKFSWSVLDEFLARRLFLQQDLHRALRRLLSRQPPFGSEWGGWALQGHLAQEGCWWNQTHRTCDAGGFQHISSIFPQDWRHARKNFLATLDSWVRFVTSWLSSLYFYFLCLSIP